MPFQIMVIWAMILYSYRWISAFQGNILLQSSGLTLKMEDVPPKQYHSTGLHGVTL
jgi:hypothetical protein